MDDLLDTTYIDDVLKGWEDFKSSHPDVEALMAEGNRLLREAGIIKER